MAAADVRIGHVHNAAEAVHQNPDLTSSVVDARGVAPADTQRLSPPVPASYVPSFSGIFQRVQLYEPQENDECANILDLAVCCCLLRTPGSAPGVTCVQEAFTLLDGENGKNDGALSLTETKRLIAAMLCVIQETNEDASHWFSGTLGIAAAKLAVQCFASLSLNACHGDTVTFPNLIAFLDRASPQPGGATVTAELSACHHYMFSQHAHSSFVPKRAARPDERDVDRFCHSIFCGISALMVFELLVYALEQSASTKQTLSTNTEHAYVPPECCTLLQFRSCLCWLVTFSTSSLTGKARPVDDAKPNVHVDRALPVAPSVSPPVMPAVPALPQMCSEPGCTAHATHTVHSPAPASAPPVAPVQSSVTPAYSGTTLCDDKSCKHCYRKSAVKRRLQSKLESRKQLGHGDVAAKHGSQAGSDGDTASVGDLGGHSEDVDQLIKFIEGKFDASKSVAAVEVVGSPKPLQDAESSKSKKKKNRKKKSASTTDARPGDAIPLGSSVSAIAASIAGVHTVELDALFDESKFEEDSELDQEVEEFRRRLMLE